MGAIFKREFKSYFTSSIGYVVLAVFFIITGLIFYVTFSSGTSDLTDIFSTMYLVILVVIPLITMRTFSEDRKQKTDQLLFTSPVGLTSIVLAKFFAAFAVFGLGTAMTLIYQLIISAYVSPDWMMYFGNVIGLCLLSASIISIGICVSVFTESQIVAAVFTFIISLAFFLIDTLASLIVNQTGWSIVTTIGNYLSPNARYANFSVGILDLPSFIYFISFTAFFLFVTVRVLERRRYA